MDIDRKALKEIISVGIKRTAQGSLIPDQLIALFIDQYTGYCLTKKWLKTEPIAQWLKGEYDFLPNEIAKLFKDLKVKIKDRVGVELLMPGEELPPEAIAPPPAASAAKVKVEEKAPNGDECWGAEWQGEPDEGREEKDEGDKLSLVSDEEAAPPSFIVSEDEVGKDDFLEITDEKAPAKKPAARPAAVPKESPISSIAPQASPAAPTESNRVAAAGEHRAGASVPVPHQVEKCAPSSPVAKPRHKPESHVPKAPPALLHSDAMAILSSLVKGGAEVDPIVAGIAKENVLTGSFERSVFKNGPIDTQQARVVRDALCWLLILEMDYSQYTGLRRIGGMILSEAVKQSSELMKRAEEKIKSLEAVKEAAAKSIRMDEYASLGAVAKRLKKTIGKLSPVVSALSYIPSDTADATAPAKFHEAGAKPEHKRAEAKVERKITPKRLSRNEKVKTAFAGLFMVCVLVGSGLYIKSLLLRQPTNIIFDPRQFATIIILKEARQSGTAFMAVVDDAYWNGMGKDEKYERCNKLFYKVKNNTIQGLLVLNTSGSILVQTYGNEIRVFK